MEIKSSFPRRMLFVSPVPFDGLRQRHQAISEGLAREGIQIIFLDPIISPGFDIETCLINPMFQVVRVKLPFRATSFPFLQSIAVNLASIILEKKKLLKPQNDGLWISEPSLSAIANKKWQKIVYDRCDKHGSFPNQSKKPFEIYENLLFKKASITIASSMPLLQEALSRGAKRGFLIPNAADSKWIKAPSPDQFPPFPPIKAISSGAHYEWIDWDWMFELLENRQIELHLVGTGRGKAFKALSNHPKVFFHGKVSHNNLLPIIDACHVGLVPFAKSPLTEAVDPIKVYEYAARGLDVWGTDLISFHSNPFVSRVIKNGNDASEALDYTYKRFSRKRRIHFEVPSWEDRIRAILEC
ncbi:hypothetical protein HYY75_07575 [bacterium]|nr:hypothetical protein [bacterium]